MWSRAIAGMFDLFPVLSHEVGHYLGLTHSIAPGALMSGTYDEFAMSRGLTDDDIAGICAIYPPSNAPLSCEAVAPAHDACADPEPLDECSLGTVRHAPNDGCSVARVGAEARGTSLFAAGTMLAFVWLLRRRRVEARVWRRCLMPVPTRLPPAERELLDRWDPGSARRCCHRAPQSQRSCGCSAETTGRDRRVDHPLPKSIGAAGWERSCEWSRLLESSDWLQGYGFELADSVEVSIEKFAIRR
jgi:hypothetical protein